LSTLLLKKFFGFFKLKIWKASTLNPFSVGLEILQFSKKRVLELFRQCCKFYVNLKPSSEITMIWLYWLFYPSVSFFVTNGFDFRSLIFRHFMRVFFNLITFVLAIFSDIFYSFPGQTGYSQRLAHTLNRFLKINYFLLAIICIQN